MTQRAIAKIVKEYVPAVVYTQASNSLRFETVGDVVERYVGYRALWMKVVIRAAFDWITYRDSLKLEQKKEAEKAYRWLFQPSCLFNSFENVCELFLGRTPDTVRQRILLMTKEHVIKIEHLDRESPAKAFAIASHFLTEEPPEAGRA